MHLSYGDVVGSLAESLYDVYEPRKLQLKKVLESSGLPVPVYNGLKWRLDVAVSRL